jgi:hypothetical protein
MRPKGMSSKIAFGRSERRSQCLCRCADDADLMPKFRDDRLGDCVSDIRFVLDDQN